MKLEFAISAPPALHGVERKVGKHRLISDNRKATDAAVDQQTDHTIKSTMRSDNSVE